MLRTYVTSVTLQAQKDLQKIVYAREGDVPPQPTHFPIIQVIRDTLAPGDTARVIVIRQESESAKANYQLLLEELEEVGIAEAQVTQICLPGSQQPEVLIGLCRDIVDALPQITRVYACITYGTKTLPVVILSALTCAETTHTELEVGGIYYGNAYSSGKINGPELDDVTVLYQLSGLVSGIRDSKTAEEVFRQLIWMGERREG